MSLVNSRTKSNYKVLVSHNLLLNLEPTPPVVTHCPQPFVINLSPEETSRSIFWKEATFDSKQSIKQIYKSKVPGHTFGPGVHFITYVATTQEGLSAKCNFKITVKCK